jgi:urocanate hydratase
MNTLNRQVSAPRCATITGNAWPPEAALRMLMNNLDPEVAVLNTSCGATRVSVDHGGGARIGYSLHAGMVIVSDGSPEADEKLDRVLTCGPGIVVVRDADGGYPDAIATAARAHMDIPMGTPGGAAR